MKNMIWGCLAVALVAASASAGGPMSYGKEKSASPMTYEKEPSEIEAAEEEAQGSWFHKFRARMVGKQYGLDDATTEKLLVVLQEDKVAKQKAMHELKDLYVKLEEQTMKDPMSEEDVLATMRAVTAKKDEMQAIEGKTLEKVITLIGTKKAADWVLSKRSMVEKMRGSAAKLATKNEVGSDKASPATRGGYSTGPTGYGK